MRTLQRGDYVKHKHFSKKSRGLVIGAPTNHNIVTVYWEQLQKKESELIDNLYLTPHVSFDKGDLVRYTDWSRPGISNPRHLKKGTLGIVTKVLKKCVEIYWTDIKEKKMHNTHKTNVYIEKVVK